MRSAPFALVLAVAVACGSGPEPAPPPDTGGGDPGGGGGGGGSQPPEGGGGGGGGSQPPEGGGGGGAGGAGGSGGTGGGSGIVTSADGTVTIERVDGTAECDFVPARAPDAVRVTAGAGSPSCGAGTSEGGGHVAAIVVSSHGGAERQVFSPDGREENRFVAGWRLFPQADGWVAAHAGSRTAPYHPRVEAFFPDGTLRRTEVVELPFDGSIHAWSAGEDPLGGALLVFHWHRMDGTGACDGEARRFDAKGVPGAIGAGIGCFSMGAGVSNRGEALVLEQRSDEVRVHWLRPDGTHVREPTTEGGPFIHGVELRPLLDGSIAVREGVRFTRRYPHLAERSEAAPAWLAGMPASWTYRFTRGNRGYAFFPPEGRESDDCSQTAELRAPSGRLCAKVTFEDPGGSCLTAAIDQGWDGTVVQRSARERCGWRWWPRLLAQE